MLLIIKYIIMLYATHNILITSFFQKYCENINKL